MKKTLMIFLLIVMVAFPTGAQTVPQAAPTLAYKQAIKQEGSASKRRWLTLSKDINKKYKIKYLTFKQQWAKDWRLNPDAASCKAITEKLKAQAKEIDAAAKAELKKTYDDLQLFHGYNVEEIKKQYGVQ